MNRPSDKRTNSSRYPANEILSREALDSMSAVELADALEHTLETATEDTYDEALTDTYLDALDRKIPIPDMPDVETAFADFQMRRRQIAITDTRLQTKKAIHHQPRKFQKVLRIGLAAALAVICILGTMSVAQVAGIDVFGAVARWTSQVFSFGQIGSGATDYKTGSYDTADDDIIDSTDGRIADASQSDSKVSSLSYASLQEALNAHNVTEVCAPTWIPDNFTSGSITATHLHDPEQLDFYAEYLSDRDVLQISIVNYVDMPAFQIEKTDTPVEKIEYNGITLYKIQNINNNVIAWVTEHFEYYISGTLDLDTLTQVALSACGS